MPTYEYVCDKCGHHFEHFQSITDKPLTVCPKEVCPQRVWGRGNVRRLIGAGAGLLFKGSGFYITDYRSESYRQAAKKEAEAAKPAGGDGKPSGGGDGKPATSSTTAKAKSSAS
jgi:putative FmdB family regulatory protein